MVELYLRKLLRGSLLKCAVRIDADLVCMSLLRIKARNRMLEPVARQHDSINGNWTHSAGYLLTGS